MTVIDPVSAAPRLARLGFLASGGRSQRGGISYLLVALRPVPTLRHFDPKRIEYWVTEADCGAQRTLDLGTRLPLVSDVSWGLIRVSDRLGRSNEYLGFGGELRAELVEGVAVAVFTSAAPLLCGGGRSQGWDQAASSVGAFFGRLLLAIDYVPGLEAQVATAAPVARYAAFVADETGRYRASAGLRAEEPDLWHLLEAEERRLRDRHPLEWAVGASLAGDLGEIPAAPAALLRPPA